MTDDRMTLMELVEKSADEDDRDLVRNMLASAAGRLMEMEVERQHVRVFPGLALRSHADRRGTTTLRDQTAPK